jgi:hypothetical protein
MSCICGDSFADVSTKSLFTDISSINFLNFLQVTVRVYLNGHYIGSVPDSGYIYFHNGFNLQDKLSFVTVTGKYLGDYFIKDKFLRRISIGKDCGH